MFLKVRGCRLGIIKTDLFDHAAEKEREKQNNLPCQNHLMMAITLNVFYYRHFIHLKVDIWRKTTINITRNCVIQVQARKKMLKKKTTVYILLLGILS